MPPPRCLASGAHLVWHHTGHILPSAQVFPGQAEHHHCSLRPFTSVASTSLHCFAKTKLSVAGEAKRVKMWHAQASQLEYWLQSIHESKAEVNTHTRTRSPPHTHTHTHSLHSYCVYVSRALRWSSWADGATPRLAPVTGAHRRHHRLQKRRTSWCPSSSPAFRSLSPISSPAAKVRSSA